MRLKPSKSNLNTGLVFFKKDEWGLYEVNSCFGQSLHKNQLFKTYYPKTQIAHNATPETRTQSMNPCSKGLNPTDFNTALDKPVPIKNKVKVSATLETVTISGAIIFTGSK